jgi:hypothetical protein
MAVLTIFRSVAESNTFVDIPISKTFAHPVSANNLYGQSTVFGRYVYNRAWNLMEGYGASSCPISLPTSDPPLPPVWPVFFSSDLVYGKDHLDMTHTFVKEDAYAFDSVVVINGAAYDLSNCTLTMTAKYSVDDTDALAVFQKDNSTLTGITVTSATDGEFTVELLNTDTSALPNREVRLVYDIQLKTSTGKRYTVSRGTLVVKPGVTRV